MTHKQRLARIEAAAARDYMSMSDDELEAIIALYPPNPEIDALIKGATDEQLERIVNGELPELVFSETQTRSENEA